MEIKKMKSKFESNVAENIPKTKEAGEPALPWKVTNEDLDKVVSKEDAHKEAITAAPPLKTRAIFIVILLVVIFIATINLISMAVKEDENARAAIRRKEQAVQSLKTNLQRVSSEKSTLTESVSQMEKRIHDMAAQKELFAAVIESLTKKADEQADSEKELAIAVESAAPVMPATPDSAAPAQGSDADTNMQQDAPQAQ